MLSSNFDWIEAEIQLIRQKTFAEAGFEKHRKGRGLSVDDLRHWQKMITAPDAIGRLMQEIDTAWPEIAGKT